MTSLGEISRYLESARFEEAEKELMVLFRESPNDPIVSYLLGCMYDDHRNPKRSHNQAHRYFSLSVGTDKPFELAFARLARLERGNPVRALRILRKGRDLFPDCPEILWAILRAVPADEVSSVYQAMLEHNIADSGSSLFTARSLANLGDQNKALEVIRNVQPESSTGKLALQLVQATYMLEAGNKHGAIEELKKLIEKDIGMDLQYGAHFVLITAILRHGKTCLEHALQVFSEIPDEFEYCPPFDICEEAWNFDYMRYLLEAIQLLLRATKRKTTRAKARGIRGLALQYEELTGQNSPTRIREDLRYAHENTPGNKSFCTALIWIASSEGDVFATYQLTIDLLSSLYGEKAQQTASEIDLHLILDCSENEFEMLVKDMERRLAGDRSVIGRVIATGVFNPVIERLHREKRYSTVLRLAKLVGSHYLQDVDIQFELAYAYRENGEMATAASYYEAHLQKHGDTSATLNNLAMIREATGQLQEAETLLKKAKRIEPDDPLIRRNLERIAALRKAAKAFRGSSLKGKKALLALWDNRDIDDRMTRNGGKLSEILGLDEAEALAVFDCLIEEKVLVPAKQSDTSIGENIYEINAEVRRALPDLILEVGHSSDVLGIAEKLTSGELLRIGYDDTLRNCLNKVGSAELQRMLDRDLREAAFCLVTNSYKSVLVMCGSIIEAVVMDRLKFIGNAKHKCSDGKMRAADRMSFAELLRVSNDIRIVSDELYHLAHALRGFRNLIHPGVEQRRAATAISESNAQIAWDITRKLLQEI